MFRSISLRSVNRVRHMCSASRTDRDEERYGEPVSDVTGHLLQQVLSNISDGGAIYATFRDRGLALHTNPGMVDIYSEEEDNSQEKLAPTKEEEEYCLVAIRALIAETESGKSKRPQGEVIRSFFEPPLQSQDPPVGDRGQQLLAHFALEELGLSRIVFSQICERDKLAEYALSAIRAQQDGVQVAQKVAAILPISTPWSDEIIAAAEPVGTLQDLRSGVEAVYAHVLGYTASTIADENGVLSHERLSSTPTKDAENDVGVVAAVGTAVARHPDLEGAVYARPSTRSSSVTQILNNEREAVAGKVDGGAWLYDNAKKKGGAVVRSATIVLFSDITLGGQSWLDGPPDITAQVALYKKSIEDEEAPLFEITADVFHLSSDSHAMEEPSTYPYLDKESILDGSIFSSSDKADADDYVLFRHDELKLAAPYNLYGPGLVEPFSLSSIKLKSLNVLSHDEEFPGFQPVLAAHREAYGAVLADDE